MVDSLYADRGRVDDPHLWERAERLGLDLERFEADRRSDGSPRGCGVTSSPDPRRRDRHAGAFPRGEETLDSGDAGRL